MDHSAFSSFNSTRLVRLFSELNDLSIRPSQAHFAEKFGQMLHFSSAVTLLRSLNDTPGTVENPSEMSGSEICNAFLNMQADLVRFIIAAFEPSTRRMDDKLPTAESLFAHCEISGVFSAKNKGATKKQASVYEPYRKFYMSRQRDLELKVLQLRAEIRDAISGFSPSLARLAQIDTALSESLSGASREIFALIPKLLEKRFRHLFDIHRTALPENPEAADVGQWLAPGGWISHFCIQMREFLLAELEIRLQPVVGMIDALPRTIPQSN